MSIFNSSAWIKTWWLVGLFSIVKLLLHLLTNTSYELQRDAFMYIDLGNHLDWGFHSVPPSIAVFANISRFLLGDTTFAIRFFPAIVGVLSIILIGIMVREAGGGKWAQFFACLAFLAAPAFLRSNTLFQPVSFNQFYWLLLAFLLFRLIHKQKAFYWYLIGLVAGLAFLNKYSVVFYLFGIVVAVLLTPLRDWLRKPQPYVAMAIAALIALPNLIWQVNHNWPVINHMQELAEKQLVNVRMDVFLLEQIMMFLPVFFIWIFGLIYVAFLKDGKPYRAFAWIYLGVVLLLIFLRGKPYYTIGLYSSLFVFGGLFIERYLAGKLGFLKYVLIIFILSISVVALPISLPILKPAAFIYFYKSVGMEKFHRWEDGEYYDLPQDYADMIGWEELSRMVGETFQKLTQEQQARCVIMANNYGEAGSVNFYGTKYNMPPVISFNDSYIFWAPESIDAEYLIKIGDSDNLEELFDQVDIIGRISTPHARQEGTPVYFCANPKTDVNLVYQEELQNRLERYHYD
jgi:4-amino-4-deoxy-L-arabinose transferase-like glycosyltransferase